MQQVQEDRARENIRLFDEKPEAMTDDVLKVRGSIDIIFELLKLGAAPEEIQRNRNLIVIGEFNDVHMYVSLLFKTWMHK